MSQPKGRIGILQSSESMKDFAFKVENQVNKIKNAHNYLSASLKITWLNADNYLTCIIEWCETEVPQ